MSDFRSKNGANDPRYDNTLRSWREVARLYNQRTGDNLTWKNVIRIGHQALRKLQKVGRS